MLALYYSEELNKGGAAYSYPELFSATFEPVEWETVILDRLKGTYAEKQDSIRRKAIDVQSLLGVISYSYFDAAQVYEYFNKYGRRYGLTKEFKENGII